VPLSSEELQSIEQWVADVDAATPPEPPKSEPPVPAPKPKNKGGQPKKHTTSLQELSIGERLTRAQLKLESLIDSPDSKKRLAAQELVRSLDSQWQVEQKAIAVAEERRLAKTENADKALADNIRAIGISSADDVRQLQARVTQLESASVDARSLEFRQSQAISQAVAGRDQEITALKNQIEAIKKELLASPFVAFIENVPEPARLAAAYKTLRSVGEKSRGVLKVVGRESWIGWANEWSRSNDVIPQLALSYNALLCFKYEDDSDRLAFAKLVMAEHWSYATIDRYNVDSYIASLEKAR
jgi:hypothetical protein